MNMVRCHEIAMKLFPVLKRTWYNYSCWNFRLFVKCSNGKFLLLHVSQKMV